MNELFIHQQYLDYMRRVSNSLEVATTISQTKCPTILCTIRAMYCTEPPTLCTSILLNFLTSKRSNTLNDASYSASQPSMHPVKQLQDLTHDEHLSSRSYYIELVRILYITRSIH